MKFEKQKVKKVSQQQNNPIWVHARYQLCAQLMVRFGMDLPPHVLNDDSINPAIIDKNVIAEKGFHLSIHQIAWWDEIHIRQKIGEILEHVFVFSRDHKGVYNRGCKVEKKKFVSILYHFM